MNSKKIRILLILVTSFLHSQLLVLSSVTVPEDEEIVLSFNHQAVGRYYISAIYSNDMIFLPVGELFSLLFIHYEQGKSGHSLQGTWLRPDNRWQVNISTQTASIGRESFSLTVDDYRVGDLDLYLAPSMYERMFGLRFTINISALHVTLKSDEPLPVEDRQRRERLRKEMEYRRVDKPFYPMLYPRERKLIGAGMLDYNIGLNATNDQSNALNYNLTGGMEFLGGDMQGSIFGSLNKTDHLTQMNNISWRYVFADNPFLTSFRTGQLNTTGLYTQRIVGGAISNDPVMPRRIYNTYAIDGNTVPDSEVELYINNQLSDFVRADELGYYRFDFPLTYGTVRINIRIYTPSGEVIMEDRQLQIPFTFLPKGVVSYNIQGGYIDDGTNEGITDKYAFHGDLSWGMTRNITIKMGSDHENTDSVPDLYYGSVSARIFDQYLLNVDAAPGLFYRAVAGVTYASGRSFNLVLTQFDGESLYNTRHANQQIDANFYVPFYLLKLPAGFRLGGEHSILDNESFSNYRADFNIRLGRFNLRTHYRDQITSASNQLNFGNGSLTSTVTYTFSRTPGIPVFVRGMFLRAQSRYDIHNNRWLNTGFQLSRTLMRNGRFNINLDHNIQAKHTYVQAGFIFDLNSLRTVTQYTGTAGNFTVQNIINGSIGLDARSGKLSLENREQTGRAAVSVHMFVDSNNNQQFDDGEEIIPARALRLDKSATLNLGKDDILRISQLQSYWTYNAEVVRTALPNPTLAPKVNRFSFMADPNRYKRIEIPLYRTGVIEGNVKLLTENIEQSLGGVRLLLKGIDHPYEETIRTFADGTYYAMNLIPGQYTLEIDPVQLTFLNVIPNPEKLEFVIEAVAEGDYLEDLNFTLIKINNNQPSAPQEQD